MSLTLAPMDNWLWYLSRSTGIVAAVLAVAALVWGLFFSARNTGTRMKIHGREFRLINDDSVEATVQDPRGIQRP